MNLISSIDSYILYGAAIGGIIGLLVALVFIFITIKKGGKVPRFSHLVPFSGDAERIMMRVNKFLADEKYFPVDYRQEPGIYLKGKGIVTAKTYIKVLPAEGGILVEGFINMYGTESGLSGFIGCIPKNACRKVVAKVIEMIQSA